VVRINSAGVHVRVELTLVDDQRRVEVALSPERAEELNVSPGETVFIKSKQIKVFEGDYVI
jgi:hypothetical protein